jgi:hypothetical protein
MFQINETEVLDVRGVTNITVGDLVQEIHHLRADIEHKDNFIELLQAQISALKSLEVMARLFQIADELDAQDSGGVPC